MVPNIQEECKAKPEEEVKLEQEESRLEELKSRLGLRGDSFFAILLHGIMRTVLEESKVRLAEEMISFRKSMADQLLNCSDHQMNEEVDVLKLDGSFRAAWNKCWRLSMNRELKRPTKCSRVVCSNPKRMTTSKPKLRDKETFLI